MRKKKEKAKEEMEKEAKKAKERLDQLKSIALKELETPVQKNMKNVLRSTNPISTAKLINIILL